MVTLSTPFKEDQLQELSGTDCASNSDRYISNVGVMSETQVSAIDSAKDLTSIFSAAAKYCLWDFLNYYLLESVVKEFCKNNANLLKLVNEYAKEVNQFKMETLLCDFLDIWPGRSSLDQFRDGSVMVMKIKGEYSTCTLQDVAEREIYLESMFHFRRFLLNFSNANRGCVQIIWQISGRLIQYIKECIESMSNKVLLSEGTVQIPGHGSCVMEVSNKDYTTG